MQRTFYVSLFVVCNLLALFRNPLLLHESTFGRDMEQVNFGQSLKNIPVPDNKTYSQMLISSADIFLETMKWKLFHHFNPPKTGKK